MNNPEQPPYDIPEDQKKILQNFSLEGKIDTGFSVLAAATALVERTGTISALIQAVYGSLIHPFLQKRQEEWQEDLSLTVCAILDRLKITEECLRENALFMDTLLLSHFIAAKTSNKTKLKNLQNALFNSALPTAPSEALVQIFLNFIDRFTEWHVRILFFLKNPEKWFHENNKTPDAPNKTMPQMIVQAYPEMEKPEYFLKQIWEELFASGLVIPVGFKDFLNDRLGNIWKADKTTDLGKQFLNFISDDR